MHKHNSTLPAGLAELIRRQRPPLRISKRYVVGAAPEKLFAVLGDLEGITRFMPMVRHAAVEHAGGCVGEGSLRVCSVRGMGKMNERIVWWDEPRGYAYRAQGKLLPLRDHLGVILIAANGDGTSTIEWRHYFERRYGPLGWLFPVMMPVMMGGAIRNIAKLLGAPSPVMGGSVAG